MSPDMSPIAQLWDELKRRVYAGTQQPAHVQQLWEAVHGIPSLNKSYHTNTLSMRRRCLTLLHVYANCGYTHYWPDKFEYFNLKKIIIKQVDVFK